ncbi:oxidoreductase-like domain-containing protein [Mizugakiibacter sediminis]|uniref:oxidoreductase-like domain-containing protein n=1 Tax=Mizugakiibacter sediminis TaxID=1475481 RepID=UPI000784E7B0|nr:oxidoreductase-like domain-containing protein [Mizugakiibacter sediminis]
MGARDGRRCTGPRPRNQPTSSEEDPRPTPPEPPLPGDCGGGGCSRCVFDVCEDARARFETALTAWRGRHPRAG